MNDDMLNDPQLQALESRLAAMALQASPLEQQRLMYACAFAAGRRAAGKTTRCWQAAAAVLALSLAVSLPFARESPLLAKRPAPPPATERTPPRPMLEELEFSPLARRPMAGVALDAWQARTSNPDSLSRDLAQFEQADAREQALALGVMTREFLNH